jgi:hypothetical protein
MPYYIAKQKCVRIADVPFQTVEEAFFAADEAGFEEDLESDEELVVEWAEAPKRKKATRRKA